MSNYFYDSLKADAQWHASHGQICWMYETVGKIEMAYEVNVISQEQKWELMDILIPAINKAVSESNEVVK